MFDSNGSGRRRQSSSWNSIGGSDTNGTPDTNDDVIIRSGDVIEIRDNETVNNMTIFGDLDFGRNRTFTVDVNLILSGSSRVLGDKNKMIHVAGNSSSTITLFSASATGNKVVFTATNNNSLPLLQLKLPAII